MRITRVNPKPLRLIKAMRRVRGPYHRLLSAILLVLFFPFSLVDPAHADNPVSSQESVGREETGEPRQPEIASADTGDKGPSSMHFRDEVHCLALNIYFEARSEPEAGQRAVGHVVMNRVAHPAYPDSVCQVVRQGGEQRLHRCQFSWWCDGRSDKPANKKAWHRSRQLAREIYLGISQDTTDGALWYHATYVKPYWSDILRQGDKIGQHIFYLESRKSGKTL